MFLRDMFTIHSDSIVGDREYLLIKCSNIHSLTGQRMNSGILANNMLGTPKGMAAAAYADSSSI